MAYSKVILNGTTIMDVTTDTVTAETLLSGETATRNDGVQITGTYEGGGGDEQLFVFCDSPGYLNAGAKVGDSNYLTASAVYYGAALVPGATVTLYTYGDYILDGVTGWKSGDTISFTTVQRGTYTFTMPSESVNCTLLYDD